jgi:hypothetical protein
MLISLISCKKEIEPDSDTFNSTISDVDTTQPNAENATIGEVPIYDPQAKEDWFLTRVLQPHVSTKNLFDLYGFDGFSEFKSKEDYWKDENVHAKFGADYGSEARMRFDERYDLYKKEFDDFKLGIYKRSPTGHELIKNDLSNLRMSVDLN